MQPAEVAAPLRVLVADDEEVVLDLYEAFLRPDPDCSKLEVVCCLTAEDAVAQAEQALRERRPFAVAFLDVRMPAGEEGLWAAERIREFDRDIEIVIATAYTDLDPATIVERVPPAEQLLYLQKPFNSHEIEQLVACLGAKWRSRRQLLQSQLRLTTAQRIAGFAHFEWDAGSRGAWWSDELCELFGLVPGNNTGHLEDLFEHIDPDDEPALLEAMNSLNGPHPVESVGYRILLPGGKERHFRQKSMLMGQRIVSAVHDVSTFVEMERRIRRLAYFDELTNLPNRSFLIQHLTRVLEQTQRSERKLALLFLDLDNFKRVNDTLGHGAGDELLSEVAQRLTRCVRGSDCVVRRSEEDEETDREDEGAIARLGGDEFIVLLSEIREMPDAARVAERIIEELSLPISLQGVDVYVGTSIGIALFPGDGDDCETLLRNSDAAMYEAKSAGKNTYRYYSAGLNEAAFRRLALESELARTLNGEQMTLHYQPLIDVATERPRGAEALLRWEHPEFGSVSPGEFIPVAEETGLIVPLGRWVLRRACQQIASWRAEGLEPLPVAVNMSFRQFRDRTLIDSVREILAETNVAPEMLCFEFTESVLMEDTPVATEILNSLQGLGAHVAMDDFGTGYSSLAYLKRLPLDRLKIDRCFVRDVTENADDQAILAAVVALGRRMQLEVVAEGVETQEQLALLAREGCTLVQGYVFSKPLPAELFAERFLTTREKNEAP